jgi:Variant SH3 domain
VVHSYEAGQEDELTLEKGDLINILVGIPVALAQYHSTLPVVKRKMSDGWFYGERVKDGKGGWFPSSYVEQVVNDHVRAKNYRERLRVIQAAEFTAKQNSQRLCSDKRATFASSHQSSPSPVPSSASSHSLTATLLAAAMTQPQQPLLIGRLRRLSNPRAFFSAGSLGGSLPPIHKSSVHSEKDPISFDK